MNASELKDYLLAEGIRPDAVSYGENALITAPEQYCLSKQGTIWEVYYSERGNKNGLRIFSNENSACTYLKSVLDSDQTVWKDGKKRS